MSVPGIVHSTLGDEEIAARVSLGGEDELFITPTRTLVYRAEGLLSDESVEEFPHDADRLTISEGRRKTKFTLEYALEGTKEFSIPAGKTDVALHPVLAGVLNGNGITDPGETVVQTYRFSELTLIVTSERLVKHIGSAVWDEEYEEYQFGDVTNLSFEDGSVATQIVLEVDGRPQRIKAPNEEADDLRERLQRALFEYHDVDSLEELNAVVGEDEEDDANEASASMDFGGGLDPLDANHSDSESDGNEAGAGSAAGEALAAESAVPGTIDANDRRREDAGTAGGSAEDVSAATADATRADDERSAEPVETGDVFENARETETTDSNPDDTEDAVDHDVVERLERLEDAVDRQSELIESQQETIELLIEELRRGR